MKPIDVISRLTDGPAQALGLPYGRLGVGAVADVAVIDPDAVWRYDLAAVRSKSKNSPFLGKELRGRAVLTILGGRVVHRV